VREPFFPQLALFVAGRPLLALYREFIFPSVPGRTGLLPAGIDDVRAANTENTPIAIDIALSRAAVVVYDSGRWSRLTLDYVRMQRVGRPMIVVAAPSAGTAIPASNAPPGDGEPTLGRPAEMSGWPHSFVEPLLQQMATVAVAPTPVLIAQELSRLADAGSWSDLLFTGLALLERQMRIQDLPAAVPLNPTGGVMQRLQDYFGPDFLLVIDAVSLRHDLLQNLQVPDPDLERVATTISDLARRRYNAPTRASGET